MRFKTIISETDYFNYQKFICQGSSAGVKPGSNSISISNSIFILIFLSYFIFILYYFRRPDTDFDWISGGSIIVFIVILFVYAVNISINNQKNISPKKQGIILGGHSYHLTEDGIEDETTHYKFFINWSGVDSVVDFQGYSYIFIDATSAFIVPHATFDSDKDISTVTKFIESKVTSTI
jgi:hypothetical protein